MKSVYFADDALNQLKPYKAAPNNTSCLSLEWINKQFIFYDLPKIICGIELVGIIIK